MFRSKISIVFLFTVSLVIFNSLTFAQLNDEFCENLKNFGELYENPESAGLQQAKFFLSYQHQIGHMDGTDQAGQEFDDSYEEFRMKMYENNNYDQFKDHVDVQDYASARRFLVGFLYLNDVEVGGETSFPKLNFDISAKCGTILLFPPTWQYRHAGRPPVSNNKYIVGTYLHYT